MNSQVHELKFMSSKFMNITNFMNLAISCSWILHELFMNKCSWTAHELFKNHSWTVHDHFTGAMICDGAIVDHLRGNPVVTHNVLASF